MPPSISSRDALVIWMFRIAMNAPIIAANMAIHTVALARSALVAAAGGALLARRVIFVWGERSSVDMTSPRRVLIGEPCRRDGLRGPLLRRLFPAGMRFDGRDHRHARAQLDLG